MRLYGKLLDPHRIISLKGHGRCILKHRGACFLRAESGDRHGQRRRYRRRKVAFVLEKERIRLRLRLAAAQAQRQQEHQRNAETSKQTWPSVFHDGHPLTDL